MGKKAKKIQTPYTTGGYQISNEAIPLIKENQQKIANWDSGATTDNYLNKYYTVDKNADYQDFLRQYNRNMADATSSNYNATSGGYSSANQRNYDDLQRYENDQATRLYSQGVNNAYNMATQDYNNLLNASAVLNNNYSLGKEYSDIEQYNNAVKQSNKNWFSNLLSSAGTALSATGNPVLGAVGGVLGTAGNMTNTSTYLDTQQGGGQAGTYGTGAYGAGGQDFATLLGKGISQTNWYKNSKLGKEYANNNNSNTNSGLFTSTDPYNAQVRRS